MWLVEVFASPGPICSANGTQKSGSLAVASRKIYSEWQKGAVSGAQTFGMNEPLGSKTLHIIYIAYPNIHNINRLVISVFYHNLRLITVE